MEYCSNLRCYHKQNKTCYLKLSEVLSSACFDYAQILLEEDFIDEAIFCEYVQSLLAKEDLQVFLLRNFHNNLLNIMLAACYVKLKDVECEDLKQIYSIIKSII